MVLACLCTLYRLRLDRRLGWSLHTHESLPGAGIMNSQLFWRHILGVCSSGRQSREAVVVSSGLPAGHQSATAGGELQQTDRLKGFSRYSYTTCHCQAF